MECEADIGVSNKEKDRIYSRVKNEWNERDLITNKIKWKKSKEEMSRPWGAILSGSAS
jgi:hypothetical protein